MPEWVILIGGVGTFIAAVVAAVVAVRKLPAEAQKINVDTVDVNVRIAGNVRDQAVEDWQRVRGELDELRKEFDQYKKDTDDRLAEQATQVRAARAGEAEAKRKADQYRDENQELRARVDELEAEVARLKAAKPTP